MYLNKKPIAVPLEFMFWKHCCSNGEAFIIKYDFCGDKGKRHAFKALPNNKILDQSKFKEFVDERIDETEKLKFVLGRIENIVGKGENAGYQHFLLFPQCFHKAFCTRSIKIVIVWCLNCVVS